MHWILLGLGAGFFSSLGNVFGKHALNKKIDPLTVALGSLIFALPLLLILLFLKPIPEVAPEFLRALLISGSINIIVEIWYFRAIAKTELSIAIPMLAFTPVFLLITAPLIVREYPPLLGIVGVLLIVIGSYFLNLSEIKNGVLKPFSTLIRNRGARTMLGISFLWSISTNFDKIGVQSSSPIFWSVALTLVIIFGTVCYVALTRRYVFGEILTHYRVLIPVGAAYGFVWVFQMTAYTMAYVSYVIALKRTNGLFSVFFGRVIFNERGIRQRFVGALIMVAGVILIAFS